MIKGFATAEGTSSFLNAFGSTGLSVSGCGFGGYRVSDVTSHREALTLALKSGVNLIDTGGDYMKGASETVVGSVLSDLSISRESIVIVSKAVCTASVSEIEASLLRSLERLQLETLDVFLLDVPLNFSVPDSVWLVLFSFLEDQIKLGSIRYYGLSVQTVDFLHLVSFAGDGFKVIQFPLNILEPSIDLLKTSIDLGLAVMTNRPLNAIRDGVLHRLVDYTDGMLIDEVVLNHVLMDLIAAGEVFFSYLDNWFGEAPNKTKDQLMRVFSIGQEFVTHWSSFDSYDRWRDSLHVYVFPLVDEAVLMISKWLHIEHLEAHMQHFLKLLNEAVLLIGLHCKELSTVRVEAVKQDLVSRLGFEVGSMSRMAIRYCLMQEGVSCVLVGMRDVVYVGDVVEELAL